MSPSASVLPARQAYPLFWWSLAALLTVWDYAWLWLSVLVPSLDLAEIISCGWSGYAEPTPDWKLELSDRLWVVGAFLDPAVPVALLLCLWLVASRGAGRPRVHAWAAFAATGLVALQYALRQMLEALNPLPEDARCTVDPATLDVTPWDVLFTFTPAILVLVGAWTGIRLATSRPGRAVPWRIVAVLAGVTVLGAGAVLAAVRLAPEPEPARVLAADGTPRYVLARIGDRLAVLDLVEGGDPDVVGAPDREFYQYTAVARDTVPGTYLAAVTTPGDGAMGDRSSRIYRIVLDGDGQATIGEQVGGDFEGMIKDLAASPEGRIAYSRVVGDPADSIKIATTAVGLVDRRLEWSASGGEGIGPFGEGSLGLHWRGADTLVFRGWPPPAHAARLLALDVSRPGSDLHAAATLFVMNVFEEGTGLSLTGETRMAVSQGEFGRGVDQRIVIVEPPAKKPAGSAFDLPCGAIDAFTVDPSGRHLLVSVNKQVCAYGAPDETSTMYELFRVDLRPAPGTATPATGGYPIDPPSLGLPQQRVWRGATQVTGLAW
ncbi:hypothetical protein ACFY05_03925 [Microtetraspora fusca]|uniref:DUF2079 domain-containing protein n=1 Tax=Microtetraspora fusca TaxID=1997 RepID=A0ABW6V240_MICFU